MTWQWRGTLISFFSGTNTRHTRLANTEPGEEVQEWKWGTWRYSWGLEEKTNAEPVSQSPSPSGSCHLLFILTLRRTCCYFPTWRKWGWWGRRVTPQWTHFLGHRKHSFCRGPSDSLQTKTECTMTWSCCFTPHISTDSLSFTLLSTMYLYNNDILFNRLNEVTKTLREIRCCPSPLKSSVTRGM